MPSRTKIWFRDAFVIIFAIYVVFSIAMVPWSNLKITEPASTSCPTGCSPSINFPEDNYHHYDDSLIFNSNLLHEGLPVVGEKEILLLTGYSFLNKKLSFLISLHIYIYIYK